MACSGETGGENKGMTMRKIVMSSGFVALSFAMALPVFAPLLLAERADGATSFLLGASLFTIAIAAVVRE
jgi:hypothetical protein